MPTPSLKQAVRQSTRTAAVLLVPAAGPGATKSTVAGGRGGQTPTPNGGGWSSPATAPPVTGGGGDFTPMHQATPTPRPMGGLTPSRLGGGAAAAGAGAGGSGGIGGAVVHPFELIEACAVAITDEEKLIESTFMNFAFDAPGGGGGGGGSGGSGGTSGPCAMTMATPTPVRGGGYTPVRGGGGGAGTATPRDGAGGAGRNGGSGGVAGNGLWVRVEDGLTAFLVLALGILRLGCLPLSSFFFCRVFMPL